MLINLGYGTASDYERVICALDTSVREVKVLCAYPDVGEATCVVRYPLFMRRRTRARRVASLQLLIDCGDPALSMTPVNARVHIADARGFRL